MFGPTMLRVVGQQCCVRLHGPLPKLQNKDLRRLLRILQALVPYTCAMVHFTVPER